MRDDRDDGLVGQGRYVRLVRRGGWEFAEREGVDGIVAIVAVTPEGRLLLVEQRREAVGARVVELPAGLAGDTPEHRGEPLETAAGRELLEETGWRAGSLTLLTPVAGPPSAGITSERITFFRADELERVGPGGGDASEAIEVHEVPLEGVDDFLARCEAGGRLVDPKVYAGLYLIGRSR